jgi:hypothetical protein
LVVDVSHFMAYGPGSFDGRSRIVPVYRFSQPLYVTGLAASARPTVPATTTRLPPSTINPSRRTTMFRLVKPDRTAPRAFELRRRARSVAAIDAEIQPLTRFIT